MRIRGTGHDVLGLSVLAITSAFIVACQSPVERGKYLVTITGCNDCHTTKKNRAKWPRTGHEQDVGWLSRGFQGACATECAD
jgi:hypothetical protein